MKKWKRKTWLMFALFVVLLIAAVTLVVVGIVTHDEPGFSEEGNSWDHAPLTVYCAGYTEADDVECSTAREVVGTVNTRLGFRMLTTVEEPGDIRITVNAPVEVGSNGPCGAPGECFELTGSGSTYTRCDVRTMNVSGGGDLQWLVIYHGLGHCLGLAHDTQNNISIMRPVQTVTPDRTIPPWISDWDRTLLRAKYDRW